MIVKILKVIASTIISLFIFFQLSILMLDSSLYSSYAFITYIIINLLTIILIWFIAINKLTYINFSIFMALVLINILIYNHTDIKTSFELDKCIDAGKVWDPIKKTCKTDYIKWDDKKI